ncbi:MAG: lipid-A-disaccharide synthase N-terminal domain-containing protein, partial [Chlamydiia bacterium]|nr:lipid-A-disaccharide synthase N-terminal domain-containing protein [Chlamydiia bacterium]
APVSFRTVLALFAFVSVIVTVLFLIQGWFFNNGVVEMFRVPVTPWSGDASAELPLLWHAIGFTGIVLFASRFWVQWWFAEKHQKSFLGGPFWWISLIGDLLSLAYFTQIKDPVNFIGPALGLIPYIRNIILIRKEQRKERTT